MTRNVGGCLEKTAIAHCGTKVWPLGVNLGSVQ